MTLLSLSDVNLGILVNNIILTYNTSTSKWVNQAIPNMSLISLSDVSISGQSNNQAILWNNSTSKWNTTTLSIINNLISDISISSIADKNILRYSASSDYLKML